ncbi:UvrD-helicase domain-containing protein [Algibacter lectus]|uniref:DNA 3'-5' helicase n=1 Tax=Algibacter lectus TaxID=221126 RepID=A0A4V3HH41_9FLAO|nr:ATP-dependent helicase [Algibacter lectus]MWW23559.1 AAA family ATPase [Algibacter lectus]TDY63761.1 superfamily I DNA/RNA helicase [Algibacter lectus]
MYKHLSEKQKKILDYKQGTVVVKACPGSGKTYSVSARISKLLNENEFKRKGIAAISFTNIACSEIEEKLKDDFGIYVPLKHPHFIGTIDSFINSYIFLPFGHLIMKCSIRPILVGEPHSNWSHKSYERDYSQFFDKTSFGLDNKLIRLAPPQAFFFPWNYYNKQGNVNGNIQNIIDSKRKYFAQGYANQSDANYIALKILEKYPLIATNVANLFEYFIIDEAQDTNEIQMRILDILKKSGTNNIMLIGDRDQSIFEWNDAKPELFDEKFDEWESILLDENRRSSQAICDFTKNLSSFDKSEAVNEEVADYDLAPQIIGYKLPKKKNKKDPTIISQEESKSSFENILSGFLKLCRENDIEINKKNVAVLYRGKSSSKYLGLNLDISTYENIPWIDKQYHVRNIILGKHLIDTQDFFKGYRLLEKGYFEALYRKTNRNFYCTDDFIKTQIELNGFMKHRDTIFNFINKLSETNDKTFNQWIVESNKKIEDIGIVMNINVENGDVLIDDYYASNLNSDSIHPFYYGTVHSVKGKTFEAVLLLLGKRAIRNYVNIINAPDFNALPDNCKEELRIVYVGITRPRKILNMAVPDSDVEVWTNKMNN